MKKHDYQKGKFEKGVWIVSSENSRALYRIEVVRNEGDKSYTIRTGETSYIISDTVLGILFEITAGNINENIT